MFGGINLCGRGISLSDRLRGISAQNHQGVTAAFSSSSAQGAAERCEGVGAVG